MVGVMDYGSDIRFVWYPDIQCFPLSGRLGYRGINSGSISDSLLDTDSDDMLEGMEVKAGKS